MSEHQFSHDKEEKEKRHRLARGAQKAPREKERSAGLEDCRAGHVSEGSVGAVGAEQGRQGRAGTEETLAAGGCGTHAATTAFPAAVSLEDEAVMVTVINTGRQ